MFVKLSTGVEFGGDITLDNEDILNIENIIFSEFKKELPEEAHRADVIKYILKDMIERMSVLKILL